MGIYNKKDKLLLSLCEAPQDFFQHKDNIRFYAIKKYFAAKTIQRFWAAALSNPYTIIGKKRLHLLFNNIENVYSYVYISRHKFDDSEFEKYNYLKYPTVLLSNFDEYILYYDHFIPFCQWLMQIYNDIVNIPKFRNSWIMYVIKKNILMMCPNIAYIEDIKHIMDTLLENGTDSFAEIFIFLCFRDNPYDFATNFDTVFLRNNSKYFEDEIFLYFEINKQYASFKKELTRGKKRFKLFKPYSLSRYMKLLQSVINNHLQNDEYLFKNQHVNYNEKFAMFIYDLHMISEI